MNDVDLSPPIGYVPLNSEDDSAWFKKLCVAFAAIFGIFFCTSGSPGGDVLLRPFLDAMNVPTGGCHLQPNWKETLTFCGISGPSMSSDQTHHVYEQWSSCERVSIPFWVKIPLTLSVAVINKSIECIGEAAAKCHPPRAAGVARAVRALTFTTALFFAAVSSVATLATDWQFVLNARCCSRWHRLAIFSRGFGGWTTLVSLAKCGFGRAGLRIADVPPWLLLALLPLCSFVLLQVFLPPFFDRRAGGPAV